MKKAQEIKDHTARYTFTLCLQAIRDVAQSTPGYYGETAIVTRESVANHVGELQRIMALLAGAAECLPSDGSGLVEVDVIATTAEAAE